MVSFVTAKERCNIPTAAALSWVWTVLHQWSLVLNKDKHTPYLMYIRVKKIDINVLCRCVRFRGGELQLATAERRWRRLDPSVRCHPKPQHGPWQRPHQQRARGPLLLPALLQPGHPWSDRCDVVTCVPPRWVLKSSNQGSLNHGQQMLF